MPRRLIAILGGILPALLLAACIGTGSIFNTPLATRPGVVDAGQAAALISQYRARRGLSPVTVDQRLMRVAADHANRMAAANRMAHVLPGEGSFQRRLAESGFDAAAAAENIGAGYDSLAEAMEGWRTSPSHDKNLLHPNVSRIGIALAIAPESEYATYWSLVLAEPYVPPPGGGGPTAGPMVVFGR